MKWILMLVGIAFGCQQSEVIKQTIDETRKKPRLNIEIRLEGNDFPTHDELALRRKLESEIERQHIGTVLDAGSGNGSMDFTVEVDETVKSIPRIRAILDGGGVLKRSTIKVVSP